MRLGLLYMLPLLSRRFASSRTVARRMASLSEVERGAAGARCMVDKLLAPPKIPVADLGLAQEDRAAARHAFQRRVFDDAFAGRRTPRVVSVVGTKGKGSCSELLRAALHEGGTYGAVGCFTSPHLHGCRERVRVGATPVSAAALERHGGDALARADAARAETWGCVFFDRLLAAALLHFGAEGCGVLVLEAGIGGLYDSTNFFGDGDLELAVITSISLDHTTMLGSTLAEIAFHKAGVMRRGVAALTPATQHPDVLRALRERAADVGADLRVVAVPAGPGAGPSTQRENRALVEAACAALGVGTGGLEHARWPARFERIEVAGRRPLLVDAAHNGDSVRRLLEDAAATYPEVAAWTVVFGCGAEKEGREDMLAALGAFAGSVESISFVEAAFSKGADALPPSKRPAAAAALAAAAGEGALRGKVAARATPGSYDVLDAATRDPRPDAAVLVCGSVYVAAEAREWAADADPACLPADDWARVLRD